MKAFNQITKALRKTIAKLENLVLSNSVEAEKVSENIVIYNGKISASRRDIVELQTEAVRAQQTAGKLRELIGE